MVRICGVYLWHCPLRKHCRRAMRKILNRPAPDTRGTYYDGALYMTEGSQRTKVYLGHYRGTLPPFGLAVDIYGKYTVEPAE